jgi:hypothetical protein
VSEEVVQFKETVLFLYLFFRQHCSAGEMVATDQIVPVFGYSIDMVAARVNGLLDIEAYLP